MYTYTGEGSISSGDSSVFKKSKASRALSIETLILDDLELQRDPRDCFWNIIIDWKIIIFVF